MLKCFHWVSIAGAPSEPRNLKTEVVFNTKSAQTFIRLYWDPPTENGGSVVEKYIIQYIVSGLPWNSPYTIETKDTAFEKLHVKLRSGGKYIARVRAQNKAGLGPASNEVLINLGMYQLKTKICNFLPLGWVGFLFRVNVSYVPRYLQFESLVSFVTYKYLFVWVSNV